jgi:hypothetical protein
MTIRCSWCGHIEKEGTTNITTHTICDDCYEKEIIKLGVLTNPRYLKIVSKRHSGKEY